ncbi:hypothetical protein D3Y57_06240 [Sphingomonas paeninsulae]|uniref:Uncharacterized protein n=1 Tax=Sphingomonas paeninsulae TaxID=2319844 RepID=A0A494TPS4_SPHPE|nr:hypothetical protein [Sphingomonas paeninsulae]AYJ87796.1 hypothetical protein D3Y57_06240 [Sphingomonas paeninsulae]
MKELLFVALAASASIAAISPAEARGGCGANFHRGPYGGCRPNRGDVIVARGAPTIGVYYGGRGYWDGRRYWGHRERWHGGWRYR